MIKFKNFMDLLEAAESPVFKSNKNIRMATAFIQNTTNKDDARKMLEAIYGEEIYPVAKAVLESFNKLINKVLSTSKLRKTSNPPTIYTQIKSFKSLADKVIERNKPLLNVGDIVRGAVLFDNNEEVEMFVDAFTRKNASMVADYDKKIQGGDPDFGYYGSHHLDLKVEGLIVELQVTTKRFWAYKGAAHDIYNNLRSPAVRNQVLQKYEKLPDSLKQVLGMKPSGGAETSDRALSKQLFTKGNLPRHVREELVGSLIEESINIKGLCDLLENADFIDYAIDQDEWELI